MKRYLLLTPLDVSRQPNNREHHILRHVASRFNGRCVVFRRRSDRNGFWSLLSDLFIPRFIDHNQENGIDYVEVNPLFNHFQGLAMDISGTYEMRPKDGSSNNWRNRIYRLISGLGVIKDLSTIFFLFTAVIFKTRGVFDVCTAMGPHGNAVAFLLKRVGKIRLWVYEDRDFEADAA